jgi:ribosome-associated toxin RatA of RatAB toxin-antitoxin module
MDTTNHTTAGGRVSVRRLIAVAIALVATFHVDVVTIAGQTNQSVSVREDGGVYTVEAHFSVPHPVAALAVLTDYERIPRFLPDVRQSTVIERANGRAVVVQEAHPSFMMFSRKVHLVLDVIEEPAAIRFRDRCAKSFSLYEGSWQVRDDDDGATVTYRLRARPSFSIPEFMLKRLLKRDATQMIERLRAEIAARPTAR